DFSALPHYYYRIRFAVSEDLDDGDVVGVVTANDSDVGLAGKIRYRIQSDGEVPLRILANGTLIVVGALDYEGKKRYVFNVTATDRGQPPRNASAQVVVDLLDVNDNPPLVDDKELAYAITSLNDVICPTVSDIDTPLADLDFFTDNPNVTTSAHHGCLKINDTVPSAINWTVSDDHQSITVKLNLLDMIPKQPQISDMNVTAFCISKGAALTICGRLRKLHYSIPMEITCANMTTSRAAVSITVTPAPAEHAPVVGFVRENAPSAVIGQLGDRKNQSKKVVYHIGDKRLREVCIFPNGIITDAQDFVPSSSLLYYPMVRYLH
ncbi:unnamed protein product, partial [Cylicostephanus goldi]